MRETNFQKANLEEVSFRGSNFQNTNLKEANLLKADFRGAQNLTLEQVKTGKNWDKAHYDSELRKQLGLPPEQVNAAKNWDKPYHADFPTPATPRDPTPAPIEPLPPPS